MHDLEPLVFGNQWVFCVAIALLLLGVSETGYRIGLRLFAARDEARRSQIGGIQGAILGLLGLLLGFTFSMAVTRFETRRDFVLREANVIGTTWLRADLLPEAHRTAAKAGKIARRRLSMRSVRSGQRSVLGLNAGRCGPSSCIGRVRRSTASPMLPGRCGTTLWTLFALVNSTMR